MARKDVIKEIKSNRKLMYLFMFFIFLFVLVTTNLVFKSLYGAYKSSDWVIVDATLLHATIDQHYSKDGNTHSLTYTPKVFYQYEINDTYYNSRKVSWVEEYNDSDMLSKAQYLVSQFNAGNSIHIYVNPDNHADAVIDRKINWYSIKGVLIACLIFWSMFIGCTYVLFTKLKLP